MIRDLLVHLDSSSAAHLRLEAALALAAACGAQVTALYLIPEPFLRDIAGLHAPADVIREHLAHAETEAEAVLAAARGLADRHKVSLVLRRETGSLDRLPTLFGRDARTADLVIVGRPDPQAGGADEAHLVEAAFMDSGRPALVLPHAGDRVAAMPPRRAIVAWGGSREAARAVHDALPLLRLAEETIVLIVDARDRGAGAGGHDEPGADLAAHLARHEVRPRIKRVTSGGTGIGELILAQAGEEGADLLVMGGYGHSRFREMLLGGVTRHVLEHATLPLLIAH